MFGIVELFVLVAAMFGLIIGALYVVATAADAANQPETQEDALEREEQIFQRLQSLSVGTCVVVIVGLLGFVSGRL